MTDATAEEPTGRILAIGDIHGCDVALATLIAHIEPSVEDTVVVLGDVVDRGPNSKGVIELLLQFSQEFNLVCIMGNHEEMMLEALTRGRYRDLWVQVGGQQTLGSYGGYEMNIPPEHIAFLQSMCDTWETDTHIFSHACLDPAVPTDRQQISSLRWNKLTGDELPHCSGKQLICGHTSQSSGRPAISRGCICIDTKAWVGQWLTCLDAANSLVWQARQAGEHRGPLPLEEIASRI